MKSAYIILFSFLLIYFISIDTGNQPSNSSPAQEQIVPFSKKAACCYLDNLISLELINQKTVDGATPLMLAANFNLVDQARTLLIMGADTSIVHPQYKINALAIAASKGYRRMVGILMHAVTAEERVAAVVEAARYGYTSVLDLFFLRRPTVLAYADINAQFEKDTALTAAIRMDKQEVVNFLLERGAIVNCATQDQCTPLYYALLYKHQEIAQLLIDRGGRLPNIYWEPYQGNKLKVSDKVSNLDFLCDKSRLVSALMRQYEQRYKEDFVMVYIERGSNAPKRDRYTFFTLKK